MRFGWLLMLTCAGVLLSSAIVDDKFLLLSAYNTNGIYQQSLVTNNITPLKISLKNNAISVKYDPRNKLVFCTTYKQGYYLNTFALHGRKLLSSVEMYYSIYNFALDPAEKLIFYAGGFYSPIRVRSYDGKNDKLIIRNANVKYGLDIYRKMRKIVFSDLSMGYIVTCNYDGSGRTVIYGKGHSNYNVWLSHLTLSQKTGKVFVTKYHKKNQGVMRMDFEGKNIEYVFDVSKTPLYDKNETRHSVFKVKDMVTLNNELFVLGRDPEHIRTYVSFRTKLDSTSDEDRYSATKYKHSFTRITGFDNASYTGPEKRSVCTGYSNGCSDLCLPLETGYVCACNDSYRLSSNNHTCEKIITAASPALIAVSQYENEGYIMGIDGNPADYIFKRYYAKWYVGNPAYTWTSLDVNYKDSQAIIFDANDRYLSLVSLNGSKKTVNFEHTASSQVLGVAYDWVHGNIYWTDAQMNWIRMCNSQGKFESTIVEQNMEKPHGIAVHPNKGLLFWTDRGEKSVIMQSDLSGGNVQQVTDHQLNKPMGIAVDYEKDVLYWTNNNNFMSYDMNSRVIKKFDYNGQHTFKDITIYQNFVILAGQIKSDKSGMTNNRLFFHDTESQKPDEAMASLSVRGMFFGVKMFDESRQKPSKSVCENYKCQHLCVGVPAKTGKGLTATCVCGDGYTVKSEALFCDKTSATEESMFVYTTKRKMCEVGLSQLVKNSATSHDTQTCRHLRRRSPNNYRCLAFDYDAKVYYYTYTQLYYGGTRNTAIKYKPFGSSIATVIHDHKGIVYGMVYDWVSSNFYWTDRNAGEIWVKNGYGHRKVLLGRRYNPYALELDMTRKRLLWTESKGHTATIMQSNLDGKNVKTLYSQSVYQTGHSITSLSYDYSSDRLYWVDGASNTVVFSDGMLKSPPTPLTNKKKFDSCYGVAVIKDFVGFTESKKNSGLVVVDNINGQVTTNQVKQVNESQAYNVIAYSKTNQPDMYGSMHPCSVDNQGCEQFCFAKQSSFSCECVYGQTLTGDKKTCAPNNLITKDSFLLLADRDNGQIYQTSEKLKGTESFFALRLPGSLRPNSIAYDASRKLVFWSDSKERATFFMDLQGKAITRRQEYRTRLNRFNHKYVTQNISVVYGDMEFDPYSGLLYTLSRSYGEISVSNRDGSLYKTIIRTHALIEFKIDPLNGYLYLFNSMGSSRIWRYDMDGNNPKLLLKTVNMGFDFTVDLKSKKIFWLSNSSQVIMSCDLEGKNVTTLLPTTFKARFSTIEAHNGGLLMSTPYADIDTIMHYDGHSVKKLNMEKSINIYDMQFVDLSNKVSGKTACSDNNGNCTHFCIPLPNQKRACICPMLSESSTNATVACQTNEDCQTKNLLHGNFTLPCNGREGARCGVNCAGSYRSRVRRLTCSNGKWDTDPNTVCIMKTCPTLQAPLNSHLDIKCPIIAKTGTSCWTRCDEGSKRTGGVEFHICLGSGKWDGKPAVCTRPDCKNDFPNGNFFSTGSRHTTNKGESAGYQCFNSYNKADQKKYTCLGNGQWNTDLSTLCLRKRCLTNEFIKNTINVCTMNDQMGSSCSYQCKSGFDYVSGSVQRFCQFNRTWDGAPMQCRVNQAHRGGIGAGVIVAIVFSVLVAIAIISAAAFFIYRSGGLAAAKVNVRTPDIGGMVDRIRVKVQKSMSAGSQLREDCPTPAAWTDVSIRREPRVDGDVAEDAAATADSNTAAGYDQPVVMASHAVNFSPPNAGGGGAAAGGGARANGASTTTTAGGRNVLLNDVGSPYPETES